MTLLDPARLAAVTGGGAGVYTTHDPHLAGRSIATRGISITHDPRLAGRAAPPPGFSPQLGWLDRVHDLFFGPPTFR